MTIEDIRMMFCNEVNDMISRKDINFTRISMYCFAMAYINGDYPEYVKGLCGVGKDEEDKLEEMMNK